MELSYENTPLRKRNKTPIPDTMFQNSTSSLASSWADGSGSFYKFQNTLRKKYEDIIFSNEYTDQETKVTCCTLSEFTADLDDLVKMQKDGFKFKFVETALCLEHRPSEVNSKYFKKHFILWILFWIIVMSTLSLFVWVHREKYNQMLHVFQ